MLICSITHPSPELKMTSNRRRHVKPLQVKYWSQRNHLKLLTENSMTRQGHDLFGQFPNPHCSCMWYVSVSCSILALHGSAITVQLLQEQQIESFWCDSSLPGHFCYSSIAAYPITPCLGPLQGEKDQHLKGTDTLSSTTMHPHQDTHSFPVGGQFIHCTVRPHQNLHCVFVKQLKYKHPGQSTKL